MRLPYLPSPCNSEGGMFKSVLIHTLANTSRCAYTDRKNRNLRVSYFPVIMRGMCRSSDAKVGVIMIDLERTLGVSTKYVTVEEAEFQRGWVSSPPLCPVVVYGWRDHCT